MTTINKHLTFFERSERTLGAREDRAHEACARARSFSPLSLPFRGLSRRLTRFETEAQGKIWHGQLANRPRSIYQYSSMAPRLSGQNCKFFKFLLSPNSQKRLRYKENNTKYRSLTWKPRSYVRILIYRTWPIPSVRRARKESWNLHSSSRAFVLMNTATMIHCKHFSEI